MTCVTEMLAKLVWETPEVRRSKIRLVMFYQILNNLIAIQTMQLIIKTNVTRKQLDITILQLQTRPSYYHYSLYPWTITLWNIMPNTLFEAECIDVFNMELAMQKIPVLFLSMARGPPHFYLLTTHSLSAGLPRWAQSQQYTDVVCVLSTKDQYPEQGQIYTILLHHHLHFSLTYLKLN